MVCFDWVQQLLVSFFGPTYARLRNKNYTLACFFYLVVNYFPSPTDYMVVFWRQWNNYHDLKSFKREHASIGLQIYIS